MSTHETGIRACSTRWRPLQSRSPGTRRLSFLFVALPAAFSLSGSRGLAWVLCPHPEKGGRRMSGAYGRRRYPAFERARPRPAAFSAAAARAAAAAALQSTGVEGDGDEEVEASGGKGTAPLRPRLEEGTSTDKRPSWREQFASLRNDAADPWSASQSAHGSSKSGSGGSSGSESSGKEESAASLGTPEVTNGSVGGRTDTVGDDPSAMAEDLSSRTGKSWVLYCTTSKEGCSIEDRDVAEPPGSLVSDVPLGSRFGVCWQPCTGFTARSDPPCNFL